MPEMQEHKGKTTDYLISDEDFQEELSLYITLRKGDIKNENKTVT